MDILREFSQMPFGVILLAYSFTGSLQADAQQEAARITVRQEYLRGVAPPEVSQGFIILRNIEPAADQPHVLILRPDGANIASQIRVSLPGINEVIVYDVAILDIQGSSVLSAVLIGGGQRAFALCFADSKGKITKVVRTNPFVAIKLQSAADGSLWGFGANGEGIADPALELFWRFDAAGIVQGRYLPRSSFKTIDFGSHPSSITRLGKPSFVSSGERIGAYLPESQEWVEFSEDGNLLSRLKLLAPTIKSGGFLVADKVVMTRSNSVFGWFHGPDSSGLYELDRSSASWMPVVDEQVIHSAGKGLFGVSGDQLIQGSTNSSDLTLTLSEVRPRFKVEIPGRLTAKTEAPDKAR